MGVVKFLKGHICNNVCETLEFEMFTQYKPAQELMERFDQKCGNRA